MKTKRRKRLAASVRVLLILPVVGLLAAILVGKMIPGHDIEGASSKQRQSTCSYPNWY